MLPFLIRSEKTQGELGCTSPPMRATRPIPPRHISIKYAHAGAFETCLKHPDIQFEQRIDISNERLRDGLSNGWAGKAKIEKIVLKPCVAQPLVNNEPLIAYQYVTLSEGRFLTVICLLIMRITMTDVLGSAPTGCFGAYLFKIRWGFLN
jgi:hypothetical protein